MLTIKPIPFGLVVSGLLFLSFSVSGKEIYIFDEAELGLPTDTVDLNMINSGGQLPGIYRVTVWINDRQVDNRDIEFRMIKVADAPDSVRTLQPCLTSAQLLRYGVDTLSNPTLLSEGGQKGRKNTCSLLSGLKGATSVFDFNQQKLQLIIPPDMLLPSSGEIAPPQLWDDGIPALLLSYQYGVQITELRGDYSGRSKRHYLQLRPGVNIGAWRMRSVLTRQNTDSWTRLYAWAERRIEGLKSRLTLGEQFSDGLGISEGVPFRGVQIATDKEMIPYAQRAFTPVIEGIAHTQARVEVSQSGYVLTSVTVPAGPFRLNQLPVVPSDGDLQVTVYESDGTRREFTVPYTTPAIAGYPGSLQYNLLAGQYRSSDPTIKTQGLLVGEVMYTLPVNLTGYSGVQVSDKYNSLTLGGGMSFGQWGAVSADGSFSDGKRKHAPAREGYRLRLRYSKSVVGTSSYFNFSTERMSDGYQTLSDTLDSWCKNDCRSYDHGIQQRMALSMSQGLGDWGRVGLNISRQTWRPNGDKLMSWGGNYTVLFRQNISASLNWNRARRLVQNKQAETENIINLMFSVPLGNSGVESSWQMTHSREKTDYQAGFQGMAMDNRLAWSAYERTGGKGGDSHMSSSASLSWAGRYGVTSGYYSDSATDRSYNLDTDGGLILTRHGLTAGQVLGDTTPLALVSVPGISGIPAGTWRGVRTDYRGYAIVSYLHPYMENSVEIRPDTRNQHAEPEYTSATTIPTRGAVTYVPFPVQRGEMLLLTLTQRGGVPVPFGAVVTTGEEPVSTGIVDETGEVYLRGVDRVTTLTVRWGQGDAETCSLQVDLNKHKKNASGLYRFSEICR
ncbi:TPA: fimbria/pilus outer membrane usher protein [Citrobacter werkmanii]|nr:fimbria/pilus outer membrane usher protein [Citrobacter werkmanii]